MNNKGFTLVELLAVIVLIGLIGLVTVPAVSRLIKDSRKNSETVNIDTILNAAYDFAQNNPDRLPTSVEGATGTAITFGELESAGLLKSDMKDPATKSPYNNSSKVTIKYHTNPANAEALKNSNNKFFGNYLFTFVK